MKQPKEKWKTLPINLLVRTELKPCKTPKILQISKLFEEGIDDFKDLMGLTKQLKSTVALESTFVINTWVFNNYLLVKTRASKFDGRKVIMDQQICSEAGVLVTQTTLSISFDIKGRKSCKFDDKISLKYKEFINS